MGTGLGPESYAIIGQERIGQLLSSKPHDRRAIIEEAAGITRFKTKKRLAELRLESARQNLARVDDIFEEVTRQMNSLKRQASKAERFAAVRDELRGRLRVVLASRMALMDARPGAAGAGDRFPLRAHQHLGRRDRAHWKPASTRSPSAVTSWTVTATKPKTAPMKPPSNWSVPLLANAATPSASANWRRALPRPERNSSRRAHSWPALPKSAHSSTVFLRPQRARRGSFDRRWRRASTKRALLPKRSSTPSGKLESGRRHAMHLLTLAGNARNFTAQGEESLAALEREAERLDAEMGQARNEQESLGVESGQARLRFESAADELKRLESEIAALRETVQTKRAEESAQRTRANQLRSEQAAVAGRRDSLEALIRNHSYSTDTVRRLLKPGALGQGRSPVGTLADFLEVSGEHEGVVDEFLREELNYVVVESWGAAEEGVRLLKTGDGRATFLIHSDAQGVLFDEGEGAVNEPGVTPLREAIKVLNGFGRSLESILPKLRHSYLVEDPQDAQRLTSRYAHAYFLTPEGECFHNATVTGGKPASEGPLALKRELREAESRLAKLEVDLAQAETEAAILTQTIEELTAQLEARSEQRRTAETDTANMGAALKQMEAEAQRIERRLQDWTLQAARNKDAREAKRQCIEQKREEAARLEGRARAGRGRPG